MSLSCPQCDSKAFKRNGFTRHGKQNHRCLDCGKQFSLEPSVEVSIVDQIEAIQAVVAGTVAINSP